MWYAGDYTKTKQKLFKIIPKEETLKIISVFDKQYFEDASKFIGVDVKIIKRVFENL